MRADLYTFTFGYVKSRQYAKNIIENGKLIIDGSKITKPSQDIDESSPHNVEILEQPKFVSRGGEKLAFALQEFGIKPYNCDCIDIGASTGGFTDCLLQNGANSVFAVDSGHSQLDNKLIDDNRVISIEKYNAKFMNPEDFPHLFDLAVMDVSFISQTLIHSNVSSILKNNGGFVTLIKPQFECGRSALNSKGVVKGTAHHASAIAKVIDSALINGLSCIDITRSPIEGGSGNTEFLAYFIKEERPKNLVTIEKIKKISQSK